MFRTLRTWSLPLAAATALLTAPAPAFADGPIIDPAPISPNTAFVGVVNGETSTATIKMGCFGPVTPGKTGHPLAGQYVKVLPVTTPTPRLPGYTGSAGTSVAVDFGAASSANAPVILRMWAVGAEIPTSLVLPCYGSGTVTFVPRPTSPTARNASVTVTFVGQP